MTKGSEKNVPLPQWGDLLIEMQSRLLNHLEKEITPNKRKKFEEVLESRTRYIVPVLENLYQVHNASAVARTVEGFGLQEMHVIEEDNPYTISRDVTRGANRWIDIVRWNSPGEKNLYKCLQSLRKRGYRILATSPEKEDFALDQLPLDKPMVFLFGNEEPGLTREAFDYSDGSVKIPMPGFTDSLNISVSAGIILHTATAQVRSSSVYWKLTPDDKRKVRYTWLKRRLKGFAELEREFWSQQQ